VRQSEQQDMPNCKFTVAIEQDKNKLRGRDAGKGILKKILKNAKISARELEQLR
jgi:hypothetical protein